MKYGYTGFGSTIAREIHRITQIADPEVKYAANRNPLNLPTNLDCYFLCAGVLIGKNCIDISQEEIVDTINVNMLGVIAACDRIFNGNKQAKICIIGSMSGFNGSYDMTYAAAKAGVHMYVENKKLDYATQHLVCVAPTIIENSGMTQRRKDYNDIIRRGKNRRQGRWLLAEEVAKVALFAVDNTSMCNTVIKLTGGNN